MAKSRQHSDHSEIIERDMPGWKLVPPDDPALARRRDAADAATSDDVSASLDDMKKKYGLHTESAGRSDAASAEESARQTTDVVQVESPSGERRTVGIKDGKVAWHGG